MNRNGHFSKKYPTRKLRGAALAANGKVCCLDWNEWRVQSQTDSSKSYAVRFENLGDATFPKFRYTCECHDYQRHGGRVQRDGTMFECKHLIAVRIFDKVNSKIIETVRSGSIVRYRKEVIAKLDKRENTEFQRLCLTALFNAIDQAVEGGDKRRGALAKGMCHCERCQTTSQRFYDLSVA